MIFEPLDRGGSMSMLAPRGVITKLGDQLSLRLYDGERLLIENAAEPDNVQMMNFEVLDVPVGNAVAPFRLRGDDEQELLLPELMEQKTPLADADEVDISEALHKRLVIALSCLFLPMLAVVLGVQSSRKRNLYQSVFALLIIIIYHQLVEFCGDFGRSIAVGPAVMLWTVYGRSSSPRRCCSTRPARDRLHVRPARDAAGQRLVRVRPHVLAAQQAADALKKAAVACTARLEFARRNQRFFSRSRTKTTRVAPFSVVEKCCVPVFSSTKSPAL